MYVLILCPLISVDTEEKLREQTETNCSRIDQALSHLQIDLVFGVDCGGDSLTGGKDHAPGMILSGRDQQVHAMCVCEQVQFSLY